MTSQQTAPVRPAPIRIHRYGSWRIEVHNNVHGLEQVFATIERHGAATAFQSFGFVSTLADALLNSGRAEPIFLLVEHLERGLSMLVPLARHRAGNMSRIGFLDLGVSDYNGPLMVAGPDLTRAEAAELWRAIRMALPVSDLVYLEKMPTHISGQSNPFAQLDGAKTMALTASSLPLRMPWATHRDKAFAPKFLADMDDRWRRLQKRATCVFEEAVPATRDEIFDRLVDQRRERFAVLGRDNILLDPVWRGFYRSLLDLPSPYGIGKLLTLRVNGEPTATMFGLAYRRVFYAIIPTFQDGPWRNYSPGMQMFSLVMAWAAERDFEAFDFTIGAEAYKANFGVRSLPLAEYVSASSAVGLPVMAAQRGKAFIRGRPRLAAALKRVAGRPA